MNVTNEEPITIEEAKKILERRKNEGDLSYEQNITYEYLKKMSKLSDKKVEELRNALQEIEILKPRHIVKIIDILPDTEEEVKLIFEKETTNLKKDAIAKIVEIVKKFK